MGEYSEECLRTFLKDQGQLFDEPVAETLEEAEAFLEDCMAVEVKNIKEVKTAWQLLWIHWRRYASILRRAERMWII